MSGARHLDAAPRMLVVDDDDRSRRLLAGMLKAQGYEVASAADGPRALDSARRTPPDVVLLDVMMPGMTGHEVCAELKRDTRTRACQVMLVTALDSEGDRVIGLDVGADDYASKPVRREELMAKVRALLRAKGLIDELELARSALAERNAELELKRTLAASVVHDLKSPLTATLGSVDLLGLRCGSEHGALIERCRAGVRRTLAMILDLLDVERLDQGQLVPSRSPVDLRDLMHATADEIRGRADGVQVELVVDASTDAPVEVDPGLIRRVLDNLVGNALDHSPRKSRIEIRARSTVDGVVIEVADQGPGVPVEMREKVFEKYQRAEIGRGGLSTNRGLGLTFCRLAVEAHEGTIGIDDAPGGGTIVRAIIPPAREAVAVAVGR